MSTSGMSLCPDSKRNFNFLFFPKKNQNSTMLHKGGIAVFSTDSGCRPEIVNHSEPKCHAYIPQPSSFHVRSKFSPFYSFVVGGFLGSKSQGRSTNNHLSMWDVMCYTRDIFAAATTECLKGFSPVPSPAKKKFAKYENLTNSSLVDSVQFLSVIGEESYQVNPTEGPKQSYAEVAKAINCKRSRPDDCPMSGNLKETRIKKDSNNRRRSQSQGHRSSRRRVDRCDRRGNPSPQTSSSGVNSPSSETIPQWKDLRLNQQEKHFSQLKSSNNTRNSEKPVRHSNSASSSDRKSQLKSEQKLEGRNRTKRRSNNRSHCDNKRGTRARNFSCDIDKINWRTGEPISGEMSSNSVQERHGEGHPADQAFTRSLTSEQSNDDCVGEQRKHDLSPPEATLRPELEALTLKCRHRSLSSECSVDSEDSFIIFQTAPSSDDSLSDLASDCSDFDSEYTYDSDSESSDEDDLCDGLNVNSQRLKEVNVLWQKEYAVESGPSLADCPDVKQSIKGEKKVRISCSEPIIHRMLAWDFAYRSSRLGCWEQMARDRDRFKTRIRQFESIISPVLTCEHRNKILGRLHQQQE